MRILRGFVDTGMFPTDHERVSACISGELDVPLIDEFSSPFAAKKWLFSPNERRMIREENHILLERGLIRPSTSP